MACFGPRALREILGPGQKRKTQFPGARGPEIEKKVTMLSGMVVRNFFTCCILTDRTPRGGKSQNTGILGPFGLGQPLGQEKFHAENRKTRFPGARGHFWGGNLSPRKVSPKNCATFLRFAFWPTGPPGEGNRKILVLSQVAAHPSSKWV